MKRNSKTTEVGTRKVIRRPRLRELTGLSDTTTWRKEKYPDPVDPFPQRILLNESGTAVGWYEDEILAWMHRRVRGMGKAPAQTRKAASKGDKAPGAAS